MVVSYDGPEASYDGGVSYCRHDTSRCRTTSNGQFPFPFVI